MAILFALDRIAALSGRVNASLPMIIIGNLEFLNFYPILFYPDYISSRILAFDPRCSNGYVKSAALPIEYTFVLFLRTVFRILEFNTGAYVLGFTPMSRMVSAS